MVATFLNSFINHAHIVKIANMAQLVNVIAPIFTNEKGCSCRPSTIRCSCSRTTKGKALQLFVDSPTYKTKQCSDVPYLDVSAAYDNGTLVLNVVNRHRDQPLDAEFELEDKQFSGPVQVSEVNGPDIKAENDFDNTKVKTVEKSATAQGKKLQYKFPAHSYTMLKAKLA